MNELMKVFGQVGATQQFDQIKIAIASPELPHVQAGTRRAILCPHFRPDQGLRVLVWQVQAHEVPRYHV